MFQSRTITFFFLVLELIACSKKNPLSLPLVKPPVQSATPSGLTTSSSIVRGAFDTQALSTSEFKSRFFATGPTYIFNILQGIDDRINDYNTDGGSHACSSQTPVAYTITPWGQSVTMYGQCAQSISGSYTGDPGMVIRLSVLMQHFL